MTLVLTAADTPLRASLRIAVRFPAEAQLTKVSLASITGSGKNAAGIILKKAKSGGAAKKGKDMLKNSAKERALGYLRYGDRTTAQMRDYLSKKGYEPEEISEAVTCLSDCGLLDDERYGRYYVQLGVEKRKSAQKIMMELRQKGIDKAKIKIWLDEYLTEEVVLANALAEARKYQQRRGLSADRADMEKIKQRLAYLGYQQNVLYKAADALRRENESEK